MSQVSIEVEQQHSSHVDASKNSLKLLVALLLASGGPVCQYRSSGFRFTSLNLCGIGIRCPPGGVFKSCSKSIPEMSTEIPRNNDVVKGGESSGETQILSGGPEKRVAPMRSNALVAAARLRRKRASPAGQRPPQRGSPIGQRPPQREAITPQPTNNLVELEASSRSGPLAGTLDAPVWSVPGELRSTDARACLETDYGYHVSLEDLFPGTGLADAWDTCSALRTALRHALRHDLMAPLLRRQELTEQQREAMLSLGSGCMISWSNALLAHEEGKVSFDSFTEAFHQYGVKGLDGATFVRKLGSLCGKTPHGTLIDIIPLDRIVAHSWHQDTGIPQNTVLLGFPFYDGYVGGGVFSSFVKLSHPLRPSSGKPDHGLVVQYELLTHPPPAPIPEEYVLRPIYSKGREIWVSNDATHVHSTPDRQLRECLWRFM